MLKRLLASPAPFVGLALIPVLALANGARSAEPSALLVNFEVAAPKGAVMMALFDSEAGYQASTASVARVLPVTGSTVAAVFEGLKPGRYAVRAFQDLDGDGVMAANPLGFPTEPLGFSNNAPVRMGPPTWSDASFAVGEGKTVQTIKVQ